MIVGWRAIHKNYWSKDEGRGRLVAEGTYACIRHPQYTGFFLDIFGMMLEWATIPLVGLIIPLLALYV